MLNANDEHAARLSLLHLEALQKRGLSNATIDAARLFSASPEGARLITKQSSHIVKSAGVGVPFLHPATCDTRLVRIRFDDPLPILDGKPSKYLSPRRRAF